MFPLSKRMDKPPVDSPIFFGESSVTAKRSPWQQRRVKEELVKANVQGEIKEGALEKLARRSAANQMLVERATKKLDKTRELLEIDDLTKVLNKKGILRRVNEAVDQHNRFETRYSLLFMDIDGFKKFNETYGHPAGDVVLKEFAEFMEKQTRGYENFGRYGGDEFCKLLPSPSPEAAEEITDRIGKHFVKKAATDSRYAGLSVSIGVRTLEPGTHLDAETFLYQADAAMFEAKKQQDTLMVHWKEGMRVPPEAQLFRKP